MQVLEVLDVETWDGGERHAHAYYLDATKCKKEDVKDAHSRVTKRVLVVFDSISDMMDNSVVKVRARALAKLDPFERQALGIRD